MNILCECGWHAWSRWVKEREGPLFDDTTTKKTKKNAVPIGDYLVQSRRCVRCGLRQTDRSES